MKKLRSKKDRIILGAILFLLFSANLLYWGNRKEGFFCDELYSYHFSHQLQDPYITAERETEGTWLNNWHSSEYFQDYLTMNEEEKFNFSGVWKTIKEDVHPPFFYLFMNLSSSVFSTVFPGIFTKWSGIFVNIFFFLLTMLFLWKLSKELTASDFWTAAVCILYGFSAGAVSTVIFIRMYSIFTFFAVLFAYLHVFLWKEVWKKEAEKNRFIYPMLSAVTMLGILNQYYFLIYAFFVCVVIWVFALVRRKYIFAAKYAAAMAAGIVGSCLVWKEMVNDIFHGYRGEEAFGNLTAGGKWLDGLSDFGTIADGELFGKSASLLLAIAAGLLAIRLLSIWWRLEKRTAEDGNIWMLITKRIPMKEIQFSFTMRDIIIVQMLIAVFFYFILISKIAPYKEDRYIFPVFPLIVLIMGILFQKLAAGMTKGMEIAVCSVLMACMLLGYLSPGVNYLYRGTEEKLQTVNMHSDLPVVYVTTGSSYRACGESVYFSNAKCTYPVKREQMDDIPQALAEVEGRGFLLFIDLYFEQHDLMAQEIAGLFPDGQMRRLFDTEYSAVYIME